MPILFEKHYFGPRGSGTPVMPHAVLALDDSGVVEAELDDFTADNYVESRNCRNKLVVPSMLLISVSLAEHKAWIRYSKEGRTHTSSVEYPLVIVRDDEEDTIDFFHLISD